MRVRLATVILSALLAVGGSRPSSPTLQTTLHDTLYLNLFCLRDTLRGPAIPESVIQWVEVCQDSFRVEVYQTHILVPSIGGAWRIKYYSINEDPQLRDTTLSFSFLPLGGVPPDIQQLLGINDPYTLLLLQDTVQANELHRRLVLNPVQVSENHDPGLRQKEVYLQYKNGVLDLSKIEGVEEVDIYDVSGRVVARLRGGSAFDLRKLPEGNYFVDIKTKWRGHFVGKLPHLGGNFNLRYREKERNSGKKNVNLEYLVRVKGFEKINEIRIDPGYVFWIRPVNPNSKYMDYTNGYSIGRVLEADSTRLFSGIPWNAVDTLNILLFPKVLTIQDENGDYYTLDFDAKPLRLWEIQALLGAPGVFGNSDPTAYNQGLYQRNIYDASFVPRELNQAQRDTFVNSWVPLADSLGLAYYDPALMAALSNLTPQDTTGLADSAYVLIGKLTNSGACEAATSFQWKGDPNGTNIIGNNYLRTSFGDPVSCDGIARIFVIGHELFGRPNGLTHPNSEAWQSVAPYGFQSVMAHIGEGPDQYQVMGSPYPTVMDKFALFLIQANLLDGLLNKYSEVTGESRIVNILANWNIYNAPENHTLFLAHFNPKHQRFFDINNPIRDTVWVDYYNRNVPLWFGIVEVRLDTLNGPTNGYRDPVYW